MPKADIAVSFGATGDERFMYYPYFYARRFELLAIRDACTELELAETTVPIFEPVTKKSSDLIRCLKELDAHKARSIVVMNPSKGDFKNGMQATWRKEVKEALVTLDHVSVGVVCTPKTTIGEIESTLDELSPKSAAILYSNANLGTQDIKKLAANKKIVNHIVMQDRITDHDRKLLPKGKLVDVRDHFNQLDKNSDYEGSEVFSDKHLSFSEHGVGYGDYSVIGSKYNKGGGEPAAVVIHAVYKQPGTGQLHVEHFVSDDIEQGVGSVGSKFLQAVAKLDAEVKKRKSEFGSNGALAAYASDHVAKHYPGLGENKRRQILHHIALIHTLLLT